MSKPSGLPPPPPGLPQRPINFESYMYRPLPPPSISNAPPGYREPYNRESDMYQFRGNGYPGNDESRAPRQQFDRSPPRAYASEASRYGGSSYRPKADDFSFRIEPPPGVDMNRMSDSYRPPPLPRSNDRRTDRGNGYGNHSRDGYHHRNQGRGTFRGRGGKAAERPFLRSNRSPTPELMPGMEEDDTVGVKFRTLEDMSDSDEADMDLSSDEEKEQTDAVPSCEPKRKQARTETKISADADSVPKWSNPDPYTALPPPDESQRKKMDVVKLIRKARVINTVDTGTKASAVSDDFISFDFNDDVDEGKDENSTQGWTGPSVPGAPAGPRGYSHRQNMHASTNQGSMVRETSGYGSNFHPQRNAFDSSLGSRKRNFDDEIKNSPLLPIMPSISKPAGGHVLSHWQVRDGMNDAPWFSVDPFATENMGHWLHKEILDFYNFVKPTSLEDSVRSEVLNRLRSAVRRRWKDADVHPFGSFPAGLYLPTADMDLVVLSNKFLSGGTGNFQARGSLYKFADFLVSEGMPVTGSIEVISKAKVPLVKYIDRTTGLKIDISFENETGLIANKTFQTWKEKFPAMPILVTVVKQFLAMRGLNEPVNGGIGGFTVTCLVVNLLQQLPQIQSGNMVPEHNLGEVLMEFFDLYGNEFNAVTTAIQFNPPGYVSKAHLGRDIYKGNQYTEKLSIIDPNNSMNDIAGGSKNTPTILKTFSNAFRNLQSRVSDIFPAPLEQRKHESILKVILGGEYSSFQIQRDRLKLYHESLTATAS